MHTSKAGHNFVCRIEWRKRMTTYEFALWVIILIKLIPVFKTYNTFYLTQELERSTRRRLLLQSTFDSWAAGATNSSTLHLVSSILNLKWPQGEIFGILKLDDLITHNNKCRPLHPHFGSHQKLSLFSGNSYFLEIFNLQLLFWEFSFSGNLHFLPVSISGSFLIFI